MWVASCWLACLGSTTIVPAAGMMHWRNTHEAADLQAVQACRHLKGSRAAASGMHFAVPASSHLSEIAAAAP